ncbi:MULTISPECIES: hypothetical protein [Anaerolinea]|uniref:hypothetical protein n=1 Tax=Anaerolinea TaxID=233189 RepID=UPI00260CD1FF|nr:hypothetical protein [Anaerolinea thermophila]
MMRRMFWRRIPRYGWRWWRPRMWLRGIREGIWLLFSVLLAGLAFGAFLLYVFGWFFR